MSSMVTSTTSPSNEVPKSPFNVGDHYPIVPQKFIRVRYGDNQETIFNPYCLVRILLESIKRRCDCQREELIDLADENGNLKNLYLHDHQYANKHLKDNCIYVIISINDNGSNRQYTCLLSDPNAKIEAMLHDLNSSVVDKPVVETAPATDKSRQLRKNNSQPIHKKQARTVAGTPESIRIKKSTSKKIIKK